MQLVNQTPLAARVSVSRKDRSQERVGMVWAKATFRWADGQEPWLDSEAPFPLFDRDIETELGLLPQDNLPRPPKGFEVILLGAAHAPNAVPVTAMTVALSVGTVRRELLVFGDRLWRGKGVSATISAPEPFVRMPLVYERAFGGTRDVLIDRDAVLRVSDPFNPLGRGFDPGPQVAPLAQLFKAPRPYPQYDERRALPNIEGPATRITHWEDAPRPACWSAMPMSFAEHALRCFALPEQPMRLPEKLIPRQLYHRAHPDWIIDAPEPGAMLLLQGLSPTGDVRFRFPALSALADYVMGSELGSWNMMPQMVVLLPEQRAFYIVYRHFFTATFPARVERSIRLRVEAGCLGGGP
jgi:hypothetical protein